MDRYRLDSHKLLYHPDRLHDWMSGKTIAPIYLEISPSGACNHRCTFCALDFMEYQARFLDPDLLLERLKEFSRLGLKSIMFGGEGEPLLHRHIGEIAEGAFNHQLDISFTTNATLLTPEKAARILPVTKWIKVSCNAGTAETYGQIHGCKADDFERVFDNLAQAVQHKNERALNCVLGLQMVLLPQNRDEAIILAEKCRAIGLDYFVIKPYAPHPLSKNNRYKDLSYRTLALDLEALHNLSTAHFEVIVRTKTIDNYENRLTGYDSCLALPFWSYLDSRGTIWGCSMHMEDDRFNYGNIYTATINEIWHGEKRHESLQWVAENLEPRSCRINCRMDKINTFLWSLTHPPDHVNFI